MKIKGFDTYKVSLLASSALAYLFVVGGLHWLVYVLVAVIVAERALVAVLLYIVSSVQKEMASRLMEAIENAQKTGTPVRPPWDQEVE